MSRKRIIIICVVLIILAALEGGAYLIWQKAYKDPKALSEREKSASDISYNRLLTTSLTKKDEYEYIVVINPAQGGIEKGNVSGEFYEKDITLSIAKKIKANNKNSRIGIFLTRENDTNPTIDQRNTIIEQLGADVLVDLNVSKDMQASTIGTRVFYQDEYYNNKLTNVDFADMAEKEIVTSIEGYAAGIYLDEAQEYLILKGKTIPAISVECGYISNTQEGLLLSRDNYQSNIADGVLNAVEQAIDKLK